MTTGFIICGALAHEVLDIIAKHGWDAEVTGISAVDHMHPGRIAPDVEAQIVALRERYERLIVVFGDCGSAGALDEVLARHHIERIEGPHCYEMYGGVAFEQLTAEEPGTHFLTDFMVRAFRGLVMKSMGLHRFPELREDYFQHYKRVVYLVQKPEPRLLERAKAIAAYLELPLEIRATGYNYLEERLRALMD
jgi:hypothetical protein